MTQTVDIGQIVHYVSKTAAHELPAIVSCSTAFIDARGVALGHVPALASDRHVHLTVFTANKPGTARPDSAPQVSSNISGTYQKWNIPESNPQHMLEVYAGTWHWPADCAILHPVADSAVGRR